MKKFLRITGAVLLVLILVVCGMLFYLSVGFNKLDFDDDFSTGHDFSSYYLEAYHEAKEAFRMGAEKMAAIYENAEVAQLPVSSTTEEGLTVDFLYVPGQQEGENLLILVSGVHGVEGFVGHAVQHMFMDNFVDPALLANTGLLLIHGVNPYGFKNNRRVTENNVDLNRNSSVTPGLYQTVNEGYTSIYDFINPQGKVKRMSLGNRFFFVKAINEIRKASMPVLRQAVLQGQYEYPEGLYFGGRQAEPQIEALIPLLEDWCAPYDKILAIDLHTGYGERGKLHFFPNPIEAEKRELTEKLFEGYSIDWGDSDDFYTVTGDFSGMLGDINQDKEFYSMLFEYGTLNSQTTMGSLKSIHIMILENQGKQHGFASEKDAVRIRGDFREMYYPSSTAWRNHIMQQTVEVFDVVIPRFIQ